MDQSDYYEKRKSIFNKYNKNASKVIANIIYEDLMKEDDDYENTK